jgi:ribulose kinase
MSRCDRVYEGANTEAAEINEGHCCVHAERRTGGQTSVERTNPQIMWFARSALVLAASAA